MQSKRWMWYQLQAENIPVCAVMVSDIPTNKGMEYIITVEKEGEVIHTELEHTYHGAQERKMELMEEYNDV